MVIRPLLALADAMKSMAAGRTDAIVPNVDRGDEIGDMAKAVLCFAMPRSRKSEQEAKLAEQERVRLADKLERDRLTAEEKLEADKRAAADREAVMAKVMAEFDAAVGRDRAGLPWPRFLAARSAGRQGRRDPQPCRDHERAVCERTGTVMSDIGAMLRRWRMEI